MQKHMKFIPFYINLTPLSLSQTTQEEIFPGPSQLQKLNQLKPVLASAKSTKNLKFSNFCTNFTHFKFEFLTIFYIFRISEPSGSFLYQCSRIHPVLMEKRYCPQEMIISIQFLLLSNLGIPLINNIKTIFLLHKNSLQESSTKFTLIIMRSIKFDSCHKPLHHQRISSPASVHLS